MFHSVILHFSFRPISVSIVFSLLPRSRVFSVSSCSLRDSPRLIPITCSDRKMVRLSCTNWRGYETEE
ncbi:hypothetical protein CsSME_00045846 [Camellia sinensis var. sinensis]